MKVKREKQEEEAGKDPEMGVHETKGRSGGDPGKIHRSKGFGVQGCRRKYRKGDKEGGCWCKGRGYEDKGKRRTWEVGARERQGRWSVEESLGSLVRGDKGRSEERGEKKT